jgi:prevent-host-death family protein
VYADVVSVEVGIRELRENMRTFLGRVKAGEDVVVTERGKPVARITQPEGLSRLDELIRQGLVIPPSRPRTPIRTEELPEIDGSLSDTVVEQRQRGF